jgi:hypothetical protein
LAKGCFGTLLFSADEEECRSCEFFDPCEETHAKNRLGDMGRLEVEINEEIVGLELDTEMAVLETHEDQKARGLFVIRKPEPAAAEPTLAAPEDISEIEVPEIEIPEIEVPDIEAMLKKELAAMDFTPTDEKIEEPKTAEPEAKEETTMEAAPAATTEPIVETPAPAAAPVSTGKKLLAIDANWGLIVVAIVNEKPDNFDAILKLVVRELIKQGVDDADVRKNYYNYTRQLMGGLHRCMILYWTDKTKTFTYRF